ncbi:GIY-YIG nuclease family protein [Chroococcidiopsis thermalis]|uniref:GIY-YIG domain-containing protein n=1 Tax=Chroococcidiopsis thermalis (strain PCC 7203) TaxID=251229 RepID=K9TZY8_CHRTP|nr:GIY-YIG nuclease family protein [Chroococcidiopsis thermalis]AFY88150.1 hypothetical protein Chro_2676 [Chroococcidiopsis thermalis PCC 7203]
MKHPYHTQGVYLVAWLHGNDAVQVLSDSVTLYNLSQMRGINAVLSRIPKSFSGVYAWYRGFEINSAAQENPEIFVSFILSELYKDHCAPRAARLPPSHKVLLQAETSLSKEKESILRRLAINQSFRELVLMLLDNALLFQQPLYIGKATNLYVRIHNHLREGSLLRERLRIAGHSIDRCRLITVATSNDLLSLKRENVNIEDEYDTDISDESDSEFAEVDIENLLEDLLSRLFIPSFTLRYG